MKCFHAPVILIVLLTLIRSSCFSQTSRITNLKASFYNAKPGVEKLAALLSLCDESPSMNIDSSGRYALYARQMATKFSDRNQSIPAFLIYDRWLTRCDLLDSALKLCDSCISKTKYAKPNDAYAKAYTQKCYITMKSNRHKEALDHCYSFLTDAESKEDVISEITCKFIIASVFKNMQQTEQALQWSLKAAGTGGDSAFTEIKNSLGIYFLAGMMYNWKAYAGKSKKDIERDSLLSGYYLDKGISFSRKFENLPMLARNLCTKASGIEDPQKMNLVGNYLNEALNIYGELGDSISIINSLTAFSDYYIDLGQPQKAVESCLKAIELAARGHAFPLPELYSKLSDCYKAAGDHEKYEETLKKIIELNDDVYKSNMAKELVYFNAKYEAQKKENIITSQRYDISKKNYIFYGMILLVALILAFGYVFFQNRKKSQALKMQQVIFEQKKSTAAAVMQAGEDERKRIAADLHDSVAQKMVAARLNLEALENNIEGIDNDQKKVMRNISSLLDESCTEVRSLSHSMMPRAFFKSGLAEAINDMLEKINNISLHTNFNCHGDNAVITKEKEIIIYRIIQECVQNTLKHAAATKLDISMNAGKSEIDITIEDNGIGFDVATANQTQSIGMKNIQSRVDYLGGTYEIDSRPGSGTMIVFYIPVT